VAEGDPVAAEADSKGEAVVAKFVFHLVFPCFQE
jgi:hypothetical protein